MSDAPEGVLPETLCFHSQQAAEKALKAVLVSQGIEFSKTHDIASIRALLPAGLAGDARVLDAVVLTDYAVATSPAPRRRRA